MQHLRLTLTGPAGPLQALFHPGQNGKPAVLLCHPHPLYGGSMRNKVIYHMAQAFEQTGCSVLRFNFRGVEGSAGQWDGGAGEVEDVRAALDWLCRACPESALWLGGFSFGCYAGLQAARFDARVTHLFALAPAVSLWDFSFMQGEGRPVAIFAGMQDTLAPIQAVSDWAATLENVTLHAIGGADHFFSGRLDRLVELLSCEISAQS